MRNLLVIILLISSYSFAQVPFTFLNKDQYQLLQKYGNPTNDEYKTTYGYKLHSWTYSNVPDKNASTTFNFDSYGGVYLIEVQWQGTPDKINSLWKKYYSLFSKKHLLTNETSDSLAIFQFVGTRPAGKLEMHKTQTELKVELINRY